MPLALSAYQPVARADGMPRGGGCWDIERSLPTVYIRVRATEDDREVVRTVIRRFNFERRVCREGRYFNVFLIGDRQAFEEAKEYICQTSSSLCSNVTIIGGGGGRRRYDDDTGW
jgi:hypothetical protein